MTSAGDAVSQAVDIGLNLAPVTPAQRSALARRVRTDADQLAVLAAKVDAGAPPGKVVLLPPAA